MSDLDDLANAARGLQHVPTRRRPQHVPVPQPMAVYVTPPAQHKQYSPFAWGMGIALGIFVAVVLIVLIFWVLTLAAVGTAVGVGVAASSSAARPAPAPAKAVPPPSMGYQPSAPAPRQTYYNLPPAAPARPAPPQFPAEQIRRRLFENIEQAVSVRAELLEDHSVVSSKVHLVLRNNDARNIEDLEIVFLLPGSKSEMAGSVTVGLVGGGQTIDQFVMVEGLGSKLPIGPVANLRVVGGVFGRQSAP